MASSLSSKINNSVLKEVIDDLYAEIESVDDAVTDTFGTLTVAAASITDSSGEISFGDEDLTTTGTVAVGTVSDGTASMTGGTISDGTASLASGAISGLTTIGSSGAADLDSGGAGSSFGGALTMGGSITGPASGDFFIDAGNDGILVLRSDSGTFRIKMNNHGIGFFGATPVARQADAGTATGTDATVINNIITALQNLGLMA